MLTRRLLLPLAGVSVAALVPMAVTGNAAPAVHFSNLVLASQGSYGEPSLALAPDGRHVAVCVPGGGGTKVWWSADRGKTFGTTATKSSNGGGDCELDFLPNGTLLDADLEVTDSNVKVSKDFGKTFDAGRPVGVEQDRQWFAHSPDGKYTYLVYHDFAAEAELYARSTDGGLTWPSTDGANPVNNTDQATAPGNPVTPAKPGQAASLVDQGGNTFSGPMLISPDGRDSYVVYSISDLGSNATAATPPYGPTRGIIVAHKSAEATSFTNKYAVTSTNGSVNGAIFPWGSVDKKGTVYVMYNSDAGAPGHFHTYFRYSKDHAATWSAPVKVDDAPMGSGVQIYSTGMAGADGVLDMAWYGTANGTSAADKLGKWSVHFAQIRNASSAHPTFTRAVVSPGFIHLGDICLNGLLCVAGGDRSLLDFFELAIGKDGMAYIAYANNAGYGSHPSTALTAPVTHAVVHNGRVIFAHQTSGRSAWVK